MMRVRGGDAGAFATLVERHQHRVIGTIARMLGSPDEAEDLAQQVFVRVWKSAARWEPSAKFTTWLLTITRNLVFNEVRRR
ncbi:MAG: RNA polymerase sigma factor, partial [Chthoniobacterales bacterium]